MSDNYLITFKNIRTQTEHGSIEINDNLLEIFRSDLNQENKLAAQIPWFTKETLKDIFVSKRVPNDWYNIQISKYYTLGDFADEWFDNARYDYSLIDPYDTETEYEQYIKDITTFEG